MSADASTRTITAYTLADWDEIDDGTTVDNVADVMRVLAAAKTGKDVEDATVDGVRQDLLDLAIRAETGSQVVKVPGPEDCQNDAELFCAACGHVANNIDMVLACAEKMKSRQLRAMLEAYHALATYRDPAGGVETQAGTPLYTYISGIWALLQGDKALAARKVISLADTIGSTPCGNILMAQAGGPSGGGDGSQKALETVQRLATQQGYDWCGPALISEWCASGRSVFSLFGGV